MVEPVIPKRKLVDITLEEAIEVLRLGEGHSKDIAYELRTKKDSQNQPFAQLYFVHKREGELEPKEEIAVNFSDSKNAVKLCRGNEYFRTCYRIAKYLEERGFDLASANSRD